MAHQPEPGQVYGVDPMIMIGGDAHKGLRRSVSVEAITSLASWKMLGRSTTDKQATDLPSPVEKSCNLDLEGVWSTRFEHTVETKWLGNPVTCPFYGMLPEPARQNVLDYWEKVKWG